MVEAIWRASGGDVEWLKPYCWHLKGKRRKTPVQFKKVKAWQNDVAKKHRRDHKRIPNVTKIV